MDGERFDVLARGLASGTSRRKILKGLIGGAIGIGALTARSSGDVLAQCEQCPSGTGCFPGNPLGECCPPDQALCCGVCVPFGPDVTAENCTGDACLPPACTSNDDCAQGSCCCEDGSCSQTCCPPAGCPAETIPCEDPDRGLICCPAGTGCFPDNPTSTCCPPGLVLCCFECVPPGPNVNAENCNGVDCTGAGCRSNDDCAEGTCCCADGSCSASCCPTPGCDSNDDCAAGTCCCATGSCAPECCVPPPGCVSNESCPAGTCCCADGGCASVCCVPPAHDVADTGTGAAVSALPTTGSGRGVHEGGRSWLAGVAALGGLAALAAKNVIHRRQDRI